MSLKILDSGVISAPLAMERDRQLLDLLDPEGTALLHFYEWDSPALTHGYFLPVSQYIEVGAWEALGGKIARRPTGGGVMFHLKDFAFSLLVPRRYPICQRSLAFRYRVLQEAIGDALVSAFPNLKGIACLEGSLVAGPFCMAKPTTCDLVFAGQKIAGAAQRLTKQGMLYQAAVSVHTPKKEFFRSIIKDLSWADLLIQEGKIGQPISPQQRQQLKTQICMYIDRVGLYF